MVISASEGPSCVRRIRNDLSLLWGFLLLRRPLLTCQQTYRIAAQRPTTGIDLTRLEVSEVVARHRLVALCGYLQSLRVLDATTSCYNCR
jgi:hypothetical protein